MMRQTAVFLIGVALVALASVGAANPDSIDEIAGDYSILAFGAHDLDPDLVAINRPDAEAIAAAKSKQRNKADIAADLSRLIARIDVLPTETTPLDAMRHRHLRAAMVSLRRQLSDDKPGDVAQEVALRFGFRPTFESLSQFDPAIAQLERALPGTGPIGDRIGELRKSAIVPRDRIEPVFRAALAECRQRTAAHITLPREAVEVQFPPEPTFPGGNDYKGAGKSVTQVSSLFPHDVDRLLILACHEVYPGHHVHFLTTDTELAGKRGWREFRTQLNGGPIVPVAESVAETATGIAFTPDERIAFERDRLYPLAGLRMQHGDQWRAYWKAKDGVLGATSTVARDYLSGKIDKDRAHQLFMRYRLQDSTSANQLLKVIDAVGSYVIASDLGWQAAERVMRGKSRDEQWRLLHKIESEPMLLADVEALR